MNNGPGLTSPNTGEPMGERLFPATQQKNVIATLIENGTEIEIFIFKLLKKLKKLHSKCLKVHNFPSFLN